MNVSGPSRAKRGIPPKSEFNKWYPAIVEIADLVDKRYPIKGMDVWKPYGLTAMGLIDSLARREMSRTCLLYTSPSPRDRQKSRMPSSA